MPEACAHSSLQGAKALLAEVGCSAMAMRQLASRAGLLPGSLYHPVASNQNEGLCVLLATV